MEQDLELRATGLYLDPSPHSDVPPGALREAQNVVIRRAGVVERRPGFKDQGVSYAAERIVGLIPYSGGLIQVTATQTRNNAGTAITSVGDAGDGFQGASHAKLQKNLYLPANTTIRRIESETATTAAQHGLPRGRSGIVSAATNPDNAWLADDEVVAYRVAFKVSINGIDIIGAPSGRMVYANETGGGIAPALNLSLPSEAVAGWVVQVYRSETVALGITPSDELALALEYELQTADISAGEIDLEDGTDQDDRKASLYTNGTQKTLLKEGTRAPGAKVVAKYEGMLFLGNVYEQPTLAVRFTSVPGGRTTVDAPFTADFNTSVDLTSADWADKAARFNGQYIWSETNGSDIFTASDFVPAETYITYAGTTTDWTLSNASPGTTTGENCHLIDTVEVEDQDTSYLYGFHDQSLGGNNQDLTIGLINVSRPSAGGMDEAIGRLADSINTRQSDIVAVHAGNGVLILEPESNSGQVVHLRVPRRFEGQMEVLSDNATVTNDGDFVTVQPDTTTNYPARLYYSELDIPEHVPKLNFIDIGARDEPIIGLAATRRSLFIFKTDGVWLMRGETPESLVLEDLDLTARLLHPKALTVLGDVVFAFTDEGLVAVTEGGVTESLSAPALEKTFRLIRENFQAEDWVGAVSAGEGLWLEGIDTEQWLLLGIPAAYTDDGSAYVYCFDLRTSAWTRWTFSDIEPSCAVRDAGRILIGGATAAGAGVYSRARQDDDAVPNADDDFDQTISSVGTVVTVGTENTYPLTMVSATDCAERQWAIGDAGTVGYVTDVSGSVVSVLTPSGDWSGDSVVTFYKTVPWIVEWTARTAKNPLMVKHWSTGALSFEELKRIRAASILFSSDLGNSGSVSFEWDLSTADLGPETARFITHREAARCAQMYLRLSGDEAAASFALTSLALDFQWAGRRVGRRSR